MDISNPFETNWRRYRPIYSKPLELSKDYGILDMLVGTVDTRFVSTIYCVEKIVKDKNYLHISSFISV
jgi:hypothetical protein